MLIELFPRLGGQQGNSCHDWPDVRLFNMFSAFRNCLFFLEGFSVLPLLLFSCAGRLDSAGVLLVYRCNIGMDAKTRGLST